MPLKILLADDSMTAQKMGVKILVDAGHTVVAVSNGAEKNRINGTKPFQCVDWHHPAMPEDLSLYCTETLA